MNPLLKAVWVAQPVLLSVLLGFMYKRGLIERFPAFSSYCAVRIVGFCAVFPFYGRPVYFYMFWVSSLVTVVLGFAAIREVYLAVFEPAPTLRRLASLIFQWALAVLLFSAILSAATVGSPPELFARLLSLDHIARFMQAGLSLLLFVIVGFTGLSFRDFKVGIGLGFGIFTSVDLVAVVTREYFGGAVDAMLVVCSTTAFTVSCFIWIAHALRTEQQAQLFDHGQLGEWNQALTKLVQP